MLHQLQRYACDHELAVKYGFTRDRCKWVIDLDQNGEFLSLRKIDAEFPLCPKYPSNLMNAGGRAHFILDAFEKILGAHEKTKIKTDSSYFAGLIEQAKETEPLFSAVALFLRDEGQRAALREHMGAQKAKDAEKATFSVEGEYLVKLESWHDWWQGHVREESGGAPSGSEMLCLLDGTPTVPVASHSKINLSRAGGISSGSVLVGFDKDSFGSFGLNASANAAMSENAVLTYTAAFNDMIQNAASPLGNVLILHGYDKAVLPGDDIFDLFRGINFDDDKAERANAEYRLKELIDNVRLGKRPELLNNSYYVFMVTGASGRVMVRDYFEGSCSQLIDSFNAWFDDLSLVSSDGRGDANTPKLSGMLTRLLGFRKNDSKKFQRIGDELSSVVPAIWRGILTGTPLPDTVASKALNHLRSRLLGDDRAIPDAIACMWLKIWLTRGGRKMKKGLNHDETSQAYHMGRMLAVYAKLQEAANPAVNVGVGQRYFASASTTPALVLGRLAALSNHHLAKLSEGLAVFYKKQLQGVADNICTELPDVMNLKDQSLFALGYYHQMAELYKGKSPEDKEE